MHQQQLKCLSLDCQHLHSYDPELYRLMTTYPQEIVPVLDVVVNEVFQEEILGGNEEPGYSVQARFSRFFQRCAQSGRAQASQGSCAGGGAARNGNLKCFMFRSSPSSRPVFALTHCAPVFAVSRAVRPLRSAPSTFWSRRP